MNYRIYSILVDKNAVHINVLFNRFTPFPDHLSQWNSDITPSSLARLMRVMSGKPALPEVCVWSKEKVGDFYEAGCFPNYYYKKHYADFTYCPHCGRRIEVVE